MKLVKLLQAKVMLSCHLVDYSPHTYTHFIFFFTYNKIIYSAMPRPCAKKTYVSQEVTRQAESYELALDTLQ